MKRLNIVNYLLLYILGIVLFTGCEKGYDYTKPEGAPTRAGYNMQVNKTLQKKDSIWVTDQLNKRSRNFRIGFEFINDKDVRILDWNFVMVSLREQLIAVLDQAQFGSQEYFELLELIRIVGGLNDTRLRDLLINNSANASIRKAMEKYVPVSLSGPPYQYTHLQSQSKTYNINGDFQTNLTFDTESLLSGLKESREFDFDFVIEKISSQELELYGHYGSNANRNPRLIPVATNDLQAAVNAANVMNVYPGAVNIKLNSKVIADVDLLAIRKSYELTNDVTNKKVTFKLGKDVNIAGIGSLGYWVARPNAYTLPADAAVQPTGTVLCSFYLYDGAVFNQNNILEIVAK